MEQRPGPDLMMVTLFLLLINLLNKHCGDATPKGTVEKITDVGTEPPLSFVDPVRIDH